ncbi:DUF7882 family protein [Microbacterium sp. MAHUQ-60]|uniref:DUF7882 family protein n=1 Tax=unclassified Microbacterium TaxID=2609290 RepID=UPI00360B992D
MGTLEYNSSHPPIDVEDELLVHLKVIIGTKLRRQESFMMTWTSLPPADEGRMSAWIHPAIPLVLVFDSASPPPVDPERVTRMMNKLNARGELIVDR